MKCPLQGIFVYIRKITGRQVPHCPPIQSPMLVFGLYSHSFLFSSFTKAASMDTTTCNDLPEFHTTRTYDPSEPIYTDPSLFERSRSLRSIAVSNQGRV